MLHLDILIQRYMAFLVDDIFLIHRRYRHCYQVLLFTDREQWPHRISFSGPKVEFVVGNRELA